MLLVCLTPLVAIFPPPQPLPTLDTKGNPLVKLGHLLKWTHHPSSGGGSGTLWEINHTLISGTYKQNLF